VAVSRGHTFFNSSRCQWRYFFLVNCCHGVIKIFPFTSLNFLTHFLDSIEVAHPRASVASELWGQRGTLYPQVQDLYPCKDAIRVKDAAYVKIQKQTTLTTRLYKVRTNLYSPTYENVPTRPESIRGRSYMYLFPF